GDAGRTRADLRSPHGAQDRSRMVGGTADHPVLRGAHRRGDGARARTRDLPAGLGRDPARAHVPRRRTGQRDPHAIRAHAVKVASVEAIPVSVPYTHREVSSQVARDGVSDVLVKITADDGLVGWGEACCGADTASVEAAVNAMAPFVIGREPWNREQMRRDAFTHGLWQF